MAQKDTDTDRDAPAAPAPRAEHAMQGMAGRLAEVVNAQAEAVEAEAPTTKDRAKLIRDVGLIARTAVNVHQLQAAEDKAADRAIERRFKQAAARVRAALHINPDEGDETDMNEQDPRLGDPKAMAEVDDALCGGLGEIALEIKAQGLHRHPARRASRGPGRQLAVSEPQRPAPPH